jgi:hypothetical protein
MVGSATTSPSPIPRLASRLRRYRIPLGLLLVLVAMYGAFLQFLDWRANRTYLRAAAEVDRLDPGWRLDDILAKREKVPDRENSAPRVAEIARKLPENWPGILHYDASFLPNGSPLRRLDRSQRDALQAVIEPAEEATPLARTLSELPRGSYEGPRPRLEHLENVGTLNALRDVNFPYGEDVRRVLFLLRIDAVRRVDQGDFPTALTNVRAMINAGRSIGDYPSVSAQQVRNGGNLVAIAQLERLLAQSEVATTALGSLQSLLEEEARHDGATIALRGDRAIVDDLLEQIHSGQLTRNAIPHYSEFPWWEKSLNSLATLRNNQVHLLQLHSRAVTVGKQSEEKQVDQMKALNDEWIANVMSLRFFERQQYVGERLLLGRFLGIPTWFGMNQANLRTGIVALAAERYRLEQDRWPESLDQLVPHYLARIPADPFRNGLLQMRKLPDGLVIYSVGFDRVDEGGKVDPKTRMNPDQGFRVWDPENRRRPQKDAGDPTR